MAWFGGGANKAGGERPLTYEDMQRAVASGTAPLLQRIEQLSAKVDTLNADHVTRADIDGIRRDMQAGFSGLDNQYIRRELAEQRYTEVTDKFNGVEKRVETLEQETSSAGMKMLTRIGIAAGLVLSILGFLISLFTNILTHLNYHP